MKNQTLVQLQSQASDGMIKLHLVAQGWHGRKPREIINNNHRQVNQVQQAQKQHKVKFSNKLSQNQQFINMFIQNQQGENQTDPSQVDQISIHSSINNPLYEQDQNNDLNYMVEKLINEESFQEQQRKPIVKKIFSLKLNDKKLYNTKWISRLEQITKPHLSLPQMCKNLDNFLGKSKEKPQYQSCIQQKTKANRESQKLKQFLKTVKTQSTVRQILVQLKYPSQQKTQLNLTQSPLAQKISQQKIKQNNTSHNQDSLLDFKISPIQDEDIQLAITYHTNNSAIQDFIEEPLNQTIYPSTQFSIRSYLTHSQILKISTNYPNFWNYVKSKALNELFMVRVLSLDDIFNGTLENITLLQKINAFRKYLDLNKKPKDSKKTTSKPQLPKPNIIPSFLISKRYELHGNKQLLQQLWDLYGQNSKKNQTQKLQKSYQGNISFTSRLANNKNDHSKSTEILKFVQFVPSLNIHANNYSKFIGQFSQLKKVYFNGISVGFKGFRISNFTTRSQNNITFVFQDFHELASLQALLIDFQFPLNILQQLQKQYEQCPRKMIKKVRIKGGYQCQNKPWVEDMFQKPSTSFLQQNNKNMYFSIVDNITMIKPSEPRFIPNRDRILGNTSSVNSSFFLNPVGYCENPAPPETQGFRSKEVSFCRIDKEKPDYERLIMYLNSITEVSKTVIIDFERMFELFTYKNKLTSLINVCCNFDAADLQLLPQPLQIVKVHEDHKANMISIKDQVKELLENESRFACLNLPNSQTRINPINCFNIIKMNEEYQSRIALYKRIKEKYSHINYDSQIFNEQFEQSITTVEIILPSEKVKNEFVCFPFHNKTFKIVRYFEPGSNNLLDLQLKQTNERSQNFIPSQETTFNQYKQRMIKQGVDFFYFSYPFGEKYKLNLKQNNIYALGVKNEIKFKKEDHLRVMYWFSKINRTEYKLVFYEQSRFDNKREQHIKSFTKQKLPQFEQIYEFGFVQDSLKQKIAQIQIYTGNNKKNQNNNNFLFKKSIQKFLLSYSGHDRSSKNKKTQAYKILTNRSTWDFILKKLKTICDDKETQLRRMLVSQQDDKEFQIIKKSLKSHIN